MRLVEHHYVQHHTYLPTNASSALVVGVGRGIIEASPAPTHVAIVSVNAIRLFGAVVVLRVRALVEQTHTTGLIPLRALIPVWRSAATLVASWQIDTFSILVAVVLASLAFVYDEVADGARVGRILVVVPTSALAIVTLWLINAVGKAGAVVESGVDTLIHHLLAFAAWPSRVGR